VNQDIVAARIRKFLVKQFPATKNVGNNESLLNNGLIDSLGILDIVTFVEKEFGFTVSDEDLLPENFGSVQNLSNFVQQKTNGTT
jgi:acyl carrier protein